jgi:hypothetical protein
MGTAQEPVTSDYLCFLFTAVTASCIRLDGGKECSLFRERYTQWTAFTGAMAS